MKRIVLLAPALAVALLVAGCTTEVTTTTMGPVTTAAPATVVAPTVTTADPATLTTEALPWTFIAELTGAEVVSPVETPATGTATFIIDASGAKGYFVLSVSNITDVIASRVHEGGPGVGGQGLLILYPGPTLEGPVDGVISQGHFYASALIGSLTGQTIADLAAVFQSGRAYVNVGTVQNPKGEIRGQIRWEESEEGE
ncbi:MAG: CHRD domain-containing protein [Thermoleophilia bacterium]|nr:CHRD domain-containing protein [Thermoleophilia bacterium]